MPTSAIKLAQQHRWLVLLLVAAAPLATLPLMLAGCSCGHDFGFHLQSWLEGAQQLHHGTLYPGWAYSPAYNAGEPRFIFYPPLSWMLGELLTSVFPLAIVPALYTSLVLAAAGLSMFAVARRFVSPQAAFIAAALYLANPYMLFTAFERTAYAELLAAVFLPWIFNAVLRERPTLHGVALPLALVWLTNAPAAVMGSYTLALLGIIRFIATLRAERRHPGTHPLSAGALAQTLIAGTALGLALPAFYLLPAAYERRFVQITMALVPGLSYPHNFLFVHTSDSGHDFVLHQVTVIALSLLLLTAALLIAACCLRRTPSANTEMVLEQSPGPPLLSLVFVAALIAFLLEPLSSPVWKHLPELAFLQFPWRFLAILSVVLALALAFTANRFRPGWVAMTVGTLSLVTVMSFTVSRSYLQKCDADETPTAVATLFRTSHGVSATDEYTPNGADNDVLRSNDPGYWLSDNVEGFAPGTTENPSAKNPDADFGLPPADETLSAQAPRHLVLTLQQPKFLILNLRDYPNWQLLRNGKERPPHLHRDDGLLAIALPAGASTLNLTWQRGWDRLIGLAISACALAVFLLTLRRSRRICAARVESAPLA